ncbi:hypothetical protein FB451DRAFT_1062713 [Mycena latifolia]|nr:hypothetical protein FB451DRAFT_1062713 [Mycena latifolia]
MGRIVSLLFLLTRFHFSHPRSTPIPLVDSNGRIVAVLAGQPRTEAYGQAVQRAFQFMCKTGAAARFPASISVHRRGLYAIINVGLVFGQGLRAPCWFNNKQYTSIAETLIQDADIGRMAGFADACFRLWAPRLYKSYQTCNARLRLRHPELRRPFPHSVFCSANFNFGPDVWTFKHRDVLNLAFGWCAIQALGDFDATKGGHLVLWDLGLVVEFPAGALILLPSATISHSNIPVQKHESRSSFTQFTQGGIFRYVDSGFRTEKELQEENPEEFRRLLARKEQRLEEGLALFSTMDELLV